MNTVIEWMSQAFCFRSPSLASLSPKKYWRSSSVARPIAAEFAPFKLCRAELGYATVLALSIWGCVPVRFEVTLLCPFCWVPVLSEADLAFWMVSSWALRTFICSSACFLLAASFFLRNEQTNMVIIKIESRTKRAIRWCFFRSSHLVNSDISTHSPLTTNSSVYVQHL